MKTVCLHIKKPFGLAYGLNHTVHPLAKVSPSWKIVFSLDKIIRERYFHHLEMNSYLHQKISHWNFTLLFSYWNRRISVIIITYVSCQVVWCSMTSSWIWSGTRYQNDMRKELIVFYKYWEQKIYMYRESLQDFF